MSIESPECSNDYNVKVSSFHYKLRKVLLNILRKLFVKETFNDNKRHLHYKSLLYQFSINGNASNLIYCNALFFVRSRYFILIKFLY